MIAYKNDLPMKVIDLRDPAVQKEFLEALKNQTTLEIQNVDGVHYTTAALDRLTTPEGWDAT